MNRREFLYRTGALGATFTTFPYIFGESKTSRRQPLDVKALSKFVDPLPQPKTLQHEELRPSPAKPNTQIPYYQLRMREAETKLHRDSQTDPHLGIQFDLPRTYARNP